MITVQHSRGPHRGITTERIPESLAAFIVWAGGTDVIECDLALRIWRMQEKLDRGVTLREMRNTIKTRIPDDCDDPTAHTAKMLRTLTAGLSVFGVSVDVVTTEYGRGRPRVEFRINVNRRGPRKKAS